MTLAIDPAVSEEDARSSELRRIREFYRRRERTVSAERYSNLDPAYLFQWTSLKEQASQLLAEKIAIPLSECRILDVGCGDGRWLNAFVELGAEPRNLLGIDLLSERINAAKQNCPSQIALHCNDASKLPFANVSFDILISFTVFSSILDSGLRISVADEMFRVLRPGGLILWYDFFLSKPWNRDVRGISSREVLTLFPRGRVSLRRMTLAPPIARTVAWNHALLERLSSVCCLCTHYFGAVEKN
jgi:ubiquinone/menaquinone biosynthesis C-methylase UbiE